MRTTPGTPLERFLSPSLNAVALAVVLVVCVQIGTAPLQDNSFLTHLATGRLMLERGSVPDADPYSWTAFGDPWTVQSWLASLIYAGIERAVGLGGIRILSTALVVALAVSLWKLTEQAGGLLSRAVAISLAIMVGVGMWVERPLMFGAVGLGLLLLAADDHLDPRWLVPILWIWANTHGSFPFAPVLLVLLAAGRWIDERRTPSVELRCLAWTALGMLLAMVGPLGPRVLTFPFQLLEKREAFVEVREWKPLDLGSTTGRIFVFQLLIALVAVIRVRRWRMIIPAVVFGAAALTSARNVVPAGIVLTPVIAAGLSGLGSIDGTRRPRLARPLVHALALVAVVLAGMRLSQEDTALRPYPGDATAWMVETGLLDTSTRVLSREVAGNYMEFAYGPDEVRVFIDDRVDMFPLELVQLYVELLSKTGDHEGALDEIDPTAVLWNIDSPLGRWIEDSDDWDVVWVDETWMVAVPTGTEAPAPPG